MRSFGDGHNSLVLMALFAGYYSLWRAGVAHGDLSTNNIMVQEDGRPLLIDFGGSTFLDGSKLEPRVDALHGEAPLTVSMVDCGAHCLGLLHG